VRLAVLAFVAFIATGCMSESDSSKDSSMDEEAPAAFLEISVSPGGESPTKLWTLHCPGGGTLPGPTRACARLARLEDPFAPVPRDVACTEIYGGPRKAEVHGMFRGRRVDARFNRTNGCEIERWDTVQFLFPRS
jgi:hypothetical protein